MSHINFSYTAADQAEGAGTRRMPLALSIFADRVHLRDALREDAEAAGFAIAAVGAVETLLPEGGPPLGDVVVLDCPGTDPVHLAAAMQLDMRAAQRGAQLIVSTTVAALDDVFGCLDQSGAQILVDPSRAERVIALGRALASRYSPSLRELSEEDRLVLLRLSEQVGQIAERLDRLEGTVARPAGHDPVFRFESSSTAFAAARRDGSDRLVRPARPPLPDPRLVRRIIRQRQLRARFFEADLFADPAWDILLDLTAARAEHLRVSVTSLCIASGVPPTTALRWIGQMTDSGLLKRVEDEADRRRAFITLTDTAAEGMARYFAELAGQAGSLV